MNREISPKFRSLFPKKVAVAWEKYLQNGYKQREDVLRIWVDPHVTWFDVDKGRFVYLESQFAISIKIQLYFHM